MNVTNEREVKLLTLIEESQRLEMQKKMFLHIQNPGKMQRVSSQKKEKLFVAFDQIKKSYVCPPSKKTATTVLPKKEKKREREREKEREETFLLKTFFHLFRCTEAL